MKDKLGGMISLLRTQVGLAPIPGDTSGSEANPCAAACDTVSFSLGPMNSAIFYPIHICLAIVLRKPHRG